MVSGPAPELAATPPQELARRLLEAARTGRPDGAIRAALADISVDELAAALPGDAARIGFWLNVYNAAVRARLVKEPGAYRRRWRFFTAAAVTVAGRRLSPNAIEHGILRRSALAAGLGYLRNPVPSRYERLFRVEAVDARVHFALNCGARSCPPLAAWEPTTLDADLDRATSVYLLAESRRVATGPGAADSTAGVQLIVPRLLHWYRGDFGGRTGILALLRRHGLVGPSERPTIRFADYDWRLDLGGPGTAG
jgi:hypothetical protein